MNKLNKVTLTAATCGLDLGDGSERAEYVNQDYILNTLDHTVILVSCIPIIQKIKNGRSESVLLVKTWKFIFSGIILMMTISHIAAVLTVIQPASHLSRCETSDVMDRMLLLL